MKNIYQYIEAFDAARVEWEDETNNREPGEFGKYLFMNRHNYGGLACTILARRLTSIIDAYRAANVVVSRDDLALLKRLNEQQPHRSPHGIYTRTDGSGVIRNYNYNDVEYFGSAVSHKTPAAALQSLLPPKEPEECECCQSSPATFTLEISDLLPGADMSGVTLVCEGKKYALVVKDS